MRVKYYNIANISPSTEEYLYMLNHNMSKCRQDCTDIFVWEFIRKIGALVFGYCSMIVFIWVTALPKIITRSEIATWNCCALALRKGSELRWQNCNSACPAIMPILWASSGSDYTFYSQLLNLLMLLLQILGALLDGSPWDGEESIRSSDKG